MDPLKSNRWLTFLGLATQVVCIVAVTAFSIMEFHWVALAISGLCLVGFFIQALKIRWQFTRVFFFYYVSFQLPLLVLVTYHFLTSGSFTASFWFAASLLIAGIYLSLLSEYGNRLLLNRGFAKDLEDLFPSKSIHFVDNDIESEIETSSIQVGYHVRVSPDQSIPCDGIVTFGSSIVDESGISGNAEPKIKNLGSVVLAGSVNKSGSIVIRALVSPRQSLAWRLRDQLMRVPTMPLTDSIFLILLTVSPIIFLSANLLLDQRGIAVLFSAFLFHFSGIFLLVKKIHILKSNLSLAAAGIFVKSFAVLNRLSKVDLILTDARGVLTEDHLKLAQIRSFGGLSDEAVLRFLLPIARKLENSEAYALMKEGKSRSIPFETIEAYSESADGGMGMVAGDEVRWQTISHESQLDGYPNEVSYTLSSILEEGGLGILLLVNGVLMGIVTLVDTMKPDVATAVEKLKTAGVELVLKGGRLKVLQSHTLPDASQLKTFLAGTSEKKMDALVHHLDPGMESQHVLRSSIHGENEWIDLITMNEDISSFTSLFQKARSLASYQGGLNWGILILQLTVYVFSLLLFYKVAFVFFLCAAGFVIFLGNEYPAKGIN